MQNQNLFAMNGSVVLSPVMHPDQILVLQSSQPLVIVDARAGLQAQQNYNSLHLQGAAWVDLENNLSQPTSNPSQGGRHPLPELATFAHLLGQLGIEPPTHVIVYDDKNAANAAARFWWMLRSVGHQHVQVLDGGMNAAIAQGFLTSTEPTPASIRPPYPVESWQLPMADIESVATAASQSNCLIIDVRETVRYRGEQEPIDLIAGHIPGAINVPFRENLNADGFFLSPDRLRAKYESVFEQRHPDQVIVHCGSGVTACHTLLAITYAGWDMPQLYVGSWSEWSRSGRPISKTDI
ncbi:MAG: sulfurtransferase [Bacteroidota bacterium]